MSWFDKVLRREEGSEGITLLKLRTARFRRLLARYGALLELLEDAAEKQGGGFVLDRQYVIALAEGAAELADAVAFDLNVLTDQHNLAFYDTAEALRAGLQDILSAPPDPAATAPAGADAAPLARAISPGALSAALERSTVLYRGRGRVACRGVAAGRVRNAGDSGAFGTLRGGDVLVAGDLAVGGEDRAPAGRPAAMLLDRGNASGPAARLARELRIPAIVALGDATARLLSGTEVTVDADEGTVYLGRVAELLDYARSTHPANREEEAEYRLLRTVRRAVFPLTLAVGLAEPALRDCRTVHDLVHLGHSLAGDALERALTASRAAVGASTGEARVMDLASRPAGARPAGASPSRPLRAFLAGLADGAAHAAAAPAALVAAASEEHALAVVTGRRGFDMIDATASATDAANTIYCRFAPRGADDREGRRGLAATAALARLGFAAARTGRDVAAWLRGLPLGEAEQRLRALGRLAARLAEQDAAGWRDAVPASIAEALVPRPLPGGSAYHGGSAEPGAPPAREGEREPPAPSDELRHRYRVLRRLLAANSELLEAMADLEADLDHLEPAEEAVRQPVLHLLDGSLLLAENLNILTGGAHRGLYRVHAEIEEAVRGALRGAPRAGSRELLVTLDEATAARVAEVGGKAANLARLRAALPGLVPEGFVLTTAAYRLFLAENRLHERIRDLFRDLGLLTGRELFAQRTAAIRALVLAAEVPRPIIEAIEAGARSLGAGRTARWAVRSSAVGEDGRMSFAGQFDSILDVPPGDLAAAFREVIASRWNDHAVLYRLVAGFTEVETPMAVLVMPMLDARAAGVLYTRDPRDDGADRMLIDAVPGLAEAMVRNAAAATSYLARRSRPGELAAPPASPAAGVGPPLDGADVRALVELGVRIEEACGGPQDVEWVISGAGELEVVQCRPLRMADVGTPAAEAEEAAAPLVRGGVTVFPGRAAGPVHQARNVEELAAAPAGAILVVRHAGPELAAVLPRVGGVIAEHGNPASHAAALLREFAVPSLVGVAGAGALLANVTAVSLDAARCAVYEGSLWPQKGDPARTRRPRARVRDDLLHERVLALNLTDPRAKRFRPAGCRSVHDIVRYCHEQAVAAMFRLGDEVGRRGPRRVRRLETTVPLHLTVLDLGGTLPPSAASARTVRPEEIDSIPFAALWRGVTHPQVSWAGRTQISLGGFASVVAGSVTDAQGGVRALGDRNYLMVAPEYVNLNARLAYHFAMVDALLSAVPENNFVNFRFRGGAAGDARRDLRARFLAEVLLRSGFTVDRRGDLVTAWLHRYPRTACETALTTLGILMACARQLDMLLGDEAAVGAFVERFLAGDYEAFA